MTAPPKPTSDRKPMLLAAGLIVVVALAVLLWPSSRNGPGEAPQSEPAAAPTTARPAAPPAAPAPAPETLGQDVPVSAGERVPLNGTVSVAQEAWEDGAPPVLTLGLGEQTESRPLEVKLLNREGQIVAQLETAPVTAGGTEARLTLPSQKPPPGRYLVQVQTTEKILFPVRRYTLEVVDSE